MFLRKILLVNWGLADLGSGNNLLDLCLLIPEADPSFLGHQCFLVQASACQIFTKWQVCCTLFMSGWSTYQESILLSSSLRLQNQPWSCMSRTGIQIKFCQIQFASSGMARCYRSTVDTSWKKTFLPVTSLEIFTVTIFIETDGYRVITTQSYMRENSLLSSRLSLRPIKLSDIKKLWDPVMVFSQDILGLSPRWPP